jgi:hypothetical protein
LHRILLIATAAALLSSRQVTIRIPLQPGEPEQIAVLTFDADRVSAQDLKKWMLLHETAYYDTPVFGYYPDCKPSDIPKLEEDIKKTKQMVNDLDANKYPPELAEVVGYLNELQSFWLWQEQQALAFLKSGKLPDSKYKGLDLAMCEARHSEDKVQTCQEVSHGWHNCVLNRMMKQLGSYPKEKWKAFLEAFGIQERLESTVD